MKRYYIEPKKFNTKNITEKDFCKYSFSAKDYRKLVLDNINIKPLSEFVNVEFTGREISSENYIKKSKHRFLKTVNIGSWFSIDEESIEYCIPVNKVYPQKWDILISKDGAGEGLGEVAVYNKENSHKLDSISAGIHCIRISNKDKRFYILGLLKSNHFKTFMDLNTAQGSTIRHSKKMALNYPITFPSKNNNPKPESIEKVVSLIVQNIIDKEEQIQIKNKKIDELIEKELRGNQKNGKPFVYSYPRIAEIKKETRLDTGLYGREYKETKFLIENYKNGFFCVNKENIKTGRTPKDYYYTRKKQDNTFLWLTPKYLKNKNILSMQFIHTKQDTNLQNGDILFTGIGTGCQGHTLLYDANTLRKVYVNQNVYAISTNGNFDLRCFVTCFFNSQIYRLIIDNNTSMGSVPAIYPTDLTKLKIPLFIESKQKEIAKEYYNKIEKNLNLTLDNYLEIEKQRNRKLGIFQLNMEIFNLREKLDNIIDKIIRDKKIPVDLNY